MRGGCIAAISVCAWMGAACSGDDKDGGIDYDGEAGLAMPATFEGWVPGVDASLGQHAASQFLLDTGAPLTLVDTDDFSDLMQGWHDLDLTLGELRFPGTEVAALDLFTYKQSRAHPFTGIIGGNLLTGFALSLDYQGHRVWLEDGHPAELPDQLRPDAVGDAIEIRAEIAGGGAFSVGGQVRAVGATRFLVRAAAEDQEDEAEGFWLLIDSGASCVVLSNRLLDLLGDRGRPRLEGISVGTISGSQTGYVTRVWRLRVGEPAGGAGGHAVEQASVPVLVLPRDDLFASLSAEVGVDVMGVVGGMFLRRYVATLDYAGERLRLLPYTSTAHIDADEFVGVGFELLPVGGEWVVGAVYPDTDAEAEGMAVGETVAELVGRPVAGLSAADIDRLLAGFSLGDEVPVGLARGAETVELAIAVEDLLPRFEAPQ